jgi:hypothetical protein
MRIFLNWYMQKLPAPGAVTFLVDVTLRLRADRVISRVISILSPLVSLSQIEALRRDVDKLANSAVDVWNSAQKSGELDIAVNQLLERDHREEWRSLQFDLVASSRGRDEADFDAISKAHPRIITLFPGVVAWRVVDLVNDDKSPPGSFLIESDQAPRNIETCIHPGRGLPERSLLVVRGKEQREEQKDFLVKVVESARKEAYHTRRALEHRRKSLNSTLGILIGRV